MPDVFVAPNKKIDTKVDEPTVKEVNTPILDNLLKNENSPGEDNSVHIFSSLCKSPGGVSFQNQDEGEKVLLFIRRAFITNVGWVLTGIFLAIFPIIFSVLHTFLGSPFAFLPMRFNLIFLLFYYLLVASYFYVNFITWYFNIALVTDKRVFDVDYTGLVFKDVAATKINLIQDVSYTQIGVPRNFFDYGDVLVQTAGTLENFLFESSPQPEEIVHIIEDLIGKRYARP